MDAYYNILVLFQEDVTIGQAHEFVVETLSGIVDNQYSIDSKYSLPILFEYEEGLYDNDYHYNDEGDNEYTSDSWFSVFFYSPMVNEKTSCLVLGPSNHAGVDFIINHADLIAKYIKDNYSNVTNVVYSIDSSVKQNELAVIISDNKTIKPEYNIVFIR